MAAHRKQIGIARHDPVGTGRDGGGDHLIVIGIRGHHAGNVFRLDDLHRLDVIGQHLARRPVDDRQPLGDRGPRQHVGQFIEQRRTGE